MTVPANVLKDALSLEAVGRAELVDALLASLDAPDPAIDALWADEAERRIDAYERGEIESLSIDEVMARYRQK